MPIETISNLVRLPRLGKIRLGIKEVSPKTGNPYPKPVDYFVCPPEVRAVFGEKPKELSVMFPVEDPDIFAQQWLRAYSLTQGLVCIGNGVVARQKTDTSTGAIADHSTKEWEWKDELTCNPQDCAEYLSKHCRRVLNLLVLLPDVPGIGCYQIDSSSFYSIVNINSMIKMLKAILGRCSMIPLTLALGPIEVSPPGIKKKTVYVMHIKKDIKLADLARIAQLPAAQVLLPEPEVEEAPEDLFPPELLAEAKAPPTAEPAAHTVGAAAPTSKTELSPEEPREPRTDHYTIVWQSVKALLKETRPKGDLVAKWFKNHFKIDVDPSLADFSSDRPPDRFSREALTGFHNELLKFKAERPGAS
jgi:hypothetical protein